MKMVLVGSSDVLSGDAAEIVRAMQSRAFGVDHLSLSDYIDWVVAQTKARLRVDLDLDGATGADRAHALLTALVAHGLAELRD